MVAGSNRNVKQWYFKILIIIFVYIVENISSGYCSLIGKKLQEHKVSIFHI